MRGQTVRGGVWHGEGSSWGGRARGDEDEEEQGTGPGAHVALWDPEDSLVSWFYLYFVFVR